MFATAVELAQGLEDLVTDLDPHVLDHASAVALLDHLDHIERLAAAGKAIAVAAIEAGDGWRGHGSRDAVGFVADRTGTPRARVREALAVTDLIASAPTLGQAFRK